MKRFLYYTIIETRKNLAVSKVSNFSHLSNKYV
jgi:hypothetical protein